MFNFKQFVLSLIETDFFEIDLMEQLKGDTVQTNVIKKNLKFIFMKRVQKVHLYISQKAPESKKIQ